MSELYHARRRSKYKGGFVKVNGRSNNSAAYNHDYYENNKAKWKQKRHSNKTPYTSAQDELHNRFDHVRAYGYTDGYTGKFVQDGLEYYTEHHPSDRLTVTDHYYEMDVPNWLSSYGARQETLDNGRQIYVDNYNTKYVGKLEQSVRRGKKLLNNILNGLDKVVNKRPPKSKRR